MTVEIVVPEMAESVFEATVGIWKKAPGDTVKQGETVLELETDKVNVAVTSPAFGTLASIIRQEGEVVTKGDILGTITESVRPEPELVNDDSTQNIETVETDEEPEKVATPLAKRTAIRLGVDLTDVTGTGSRGRVTEADVRSAALNKGNGDGTESTPPSIQEEFSSADMAKLAESESAASYVYLPKNEDERRIRLTRRQMTMMQRMVSVQKDTVMTTTYNEVDMTAVLAMRERHGAAFEERYGVRLGLMSFFVKACIFALEDFPILNAELSENELVYRNRKHIGVAVSTEDGLVVPVIRDADAKSFSDIEKDIRHLAKRARNNELTLEDLRGGTFTITNGGVFGSLFSTPILNPPQVGILGMHTIQNRPIAIKENLEVRPMMYLAVTYDHRIVEGADSVRFLVRIKELIEAPERMVIGL